MPFRAPLALVLGLLLLVTGCGRAGSRPGSGTAAPAWSTAPSPTPTPVATPSPKRTGPPPPVRPRPTGLPAGLRKTTGVRGVALTFDDGPDPVYTPQVLDQLRAARVKATFCVIGSRARRYPELVARIAREGHQLCNHSWNHDIELGRRPKAAIRADLRRTSAAIRDAVPDARIPFYRQPGGRWTAEVVAVAKELGMRSLHWTVDPQDWAKPTGPTITKRVTTAARPGAVVLLHDGGGDRRATMSACRHVIKDLKRRYGIVKLR
ncbi:polysaccharide deacetylase family protein [Micromonospora fluostatini]|uniref:polysaccharide deacetylase family protein n=1 Tax=Micromonospora sp. JCM 30529 TaxID=3421643 RepID=UPI003D172A6F